MKHRNARGIHFGTIIVAVSSLFVLIILFTVRNLSSARRFYIDAMTDEILNANIKETKIRYSEILSLTSKTDINSGSYSSQGDKEPLVVVYRASVVDSTADQRSNLKETVTTSLNSMFHSHVAPNVEVFDSLLTLSLKAKDCYTPYKLELFNQDQRNSPIMTMAAEDYRSGAMFQSSVEVPTGSDGRMLYRITFPVIPLILKHTGLLLILEIIVFMILFFSILHFITLLNAKNEALMLNEEFVHMVTHNMNNPIAIALAAVNTLQTLPCPAPNPKRLAYIDVIANQLKRLEAEVKSVLQGSLTNGIHEPADFLEINLQQAVQSAAEQMKIPNNEAQISVDIPSDIVIKADPAIFDQMLFNLIENAIKYTDSTPVINISYRGEDGVSSMAVSDKGKGISPEDIDKIFETYYKVEELSSTPGYGLGLSFVKQAVDIHGWDIEVESKLGEGSVFTIVFNRKNNNRRKCKRVS